MNVNFAIYSHVRNSRTTEGTVFIHGASGSGRSFALHAFMIQNNIKPFCNNWRKMHGKPMLRKRTGMRKVKYWEQYLDFLL